MGYPAQLEGDAHFLVDVGDDLTREQEAKRWRWVAPMEQEAFEALAVSDPRAFARLAALIRSACRGNLIDVRDDTDIVKYPLGRLIKANRGSLRIWIAEFRRDAVAKTGCYRVYFTDVAPTEDFDVQAPMVGLLFLHYPKPGLKFQAQNRDIDSAMNLARTHLVNRGLTVRSEAL